MYVSIQSYWPLQELGPFPRSISARLSRFLIANWGQLLRFVSITRWEVLLALHFPRCWRKQHLLEVRIHKTTKEEALFSWCVFQPLGSMQDWTSSPSLSYSLSFQKRCKFYSTKPLSDESLLMWTGNALLKSLIIRSESQSASMHGTRLVLGCPGLFGVISSSNDLPNWSHCIN